MNKELREAVARAMAAKDSGPEGSALFTTHWREFGEGYLSGADAAISIIRPAVLEEAAKVADGNAQEAWNDANASDTRGLMRLQAEDIASAIRALAKEGE